jgi:hypothetical protein
MTDPKPKNTHGGPRTGAGRKPRGDQPRVMIPGVRLPADMAAFLESVESRTATIEKALQKLPEYKTWKKLSRPT